MIVPRPPNTPEQNEAARERRRAADRRRYHDNIEAARANVREKMRQRLANPEKRARMAMLAKIKYWEKPEYMREMKRKDMAKNGAKYRATARVTYKAMKASNPTKWAKFLASNNAWRIANPEKRKEILARYAKSDVGKATAKRYQQTEKCKEAVKAWRIRTGFDIKNYIRINYPAELREVATVNLLIKRTIRHENRK